MSLSIKGKITNILIAESGTSSGGKEWRKQSFVIDTGDSYNPDLCFSLFGDEKIDILSKFNIGDYVNVCFNISSREFKGKYYHNIDAWKIDASDGNLGSEPVPTIFPDEDDVPF